MKTTILILFTLISFVSFGQKSPPQLAEGTVNGTKITVDYSSPRVKGRVIYGNLVPYGEVWRAGANKNTTVEFSNDVEINGQKLTAGKYGFFIIPNENGGWTAIFSKKNDAWGAFTYNKSDDALRVGVKVKTNKDNQEELVYTITNKGIEFSWADKNFMLYIR